MVVSKTIWVEVMWIKRKLIQLLILSLSPSGLMVGVYIDTLLAVNALVHLPPPKDPFEKKEPIILPAKGEWDDDWDGCDPDLGFCYELQA